MLKELRVKNELTQQDLAYFLDTTEATISRYESNERTPPIPVFNKICEVLKLSNKQKAELLQSFDKRKGE